MKKILACLLLLLPCLLPSAAEAKAGQLDRSFGHDGKVGVLLTPPPPAGNEFIGLGWGGEGKIVVSVAQRLIEYLPDGSWNRDFGTQGRVEVVSPEGKRPTLRGLAVDSQGRILVAGDEESDVVVARYLPDGQLDQSFGKDGWTVTDLGVPESPSVRARGLTVDAADRPVLTGSWVDGYAKCVTEQGYVARFTTEGDLDRGFDLDGVRRTDKDAVSSPVADDSGIFFIDHAPNCFGAPERPILARVLSDGSPDTEFGSGGEVELPFEVAPALTRDRFSRALLAGWPETSLATLLRLRPDGSPDSRFGQADGKVLLELPGQVPALAVDSHGRPVLATNEKRSKRGWDIVVRRRLADGSRDRSFGSRGEASVRFWGYVSADRILIGGRGQVLVAGQFKREGSYGVALARFRGR